MGTSGEPNNKHETGVTVTKFGELDRTDPLNWPDGEFILGCLEQHKVLDLHHQQSEDDENANGSLFLRDAKFWQACARRALLHKYGYLPPDDNDDEGKLTSRNVQTVEEMETIQRLWTELAGKALSGEETSSTKNDLVEFVQSQCQQSNHRTLQWSAMNCQPGTQFKLHAHPNLELVYCGQGALHEIRMQGDPLTKDFERDDDEGVLKGPNLTALQRPWRFATLPAGRWLVNEVGSIHKSFSSTAGTGCQLLVLWGGSHANISDPPTTVNVQDALDATDKKLVKSSRTTCNGDCTNWAKISETFLPESERSTSGSHHQ